MDRYDMLLQRDAVFSIGKVMAVHGRRVRISVHKQKNSSHLLYNGEVIRNVAVGGYIKIAKGFNELIAVVDGEMIEEDRTASRDYRRKSDPLLRELQVSLIGYLERGKFIRGVREMPLLDNECFILDKDEFNRIHAFVSDRDIALHIGALAMEPTQSVQVGVNAIFASHIGIFGNTGSGKSYTLAKLYQQLFKRFSNESGFGQNAQFVLIDFNGEYVDRQSIDTDDYSTEVITHEANKVEYALSTRTAHGPKLPLPKSAIQDVVFWTVLLDATEKTQVPFLARVLSSEFWNRCLQDISMIHSIIIDLILRATKSSDRSIDRQTVLNMLEEIRTCIGTTASDNMGILISEFRANLNYNAAHSCFFWGPWQPPYMKPGHADWDSSIRDKVINAGIEFSNVQSGIDLIRFKIILQYYSDIISGFSNREHLAPLIKRMERRIPDIKKLIVEEATEATTPSKPLMIVSLRDVNLSMRKVIPMLLCKHLYDRKKEDDSDNESYLNIIIDEAHNILSTESTRESESWRDYRLETFEEIIKEGRKFGVFLTIASQRPHDISPTIISQLHNYFLHRLVNDLDIKAVEKAVAYLDRISSESLPILPTGVCILAGVSAQIPVMVKVSEMEEKSAPNSRTMSVTKMWLRLPSIPEHEDLHDVERFENVLTVV